MTEENHCFIKASESIVDWSEAKTIVVDPKNIDEIQEITNNINARTIIQLLPERYLVDKTIFISDNVWLKGSDRGKTYLTLKSDSNCHILANNNYRKGNSNIKVSNITFEGNSSNQKRIPGDKRPLTCNAMYFKNLSRGEFNDLQVNDILHAGLHFDKCQHIKIKNFSSFHVGWSGISSNQLDNSIVLDAYIYNSGLDKMHSGIHLDGGNGLYVKARVEQATGNGVMIDSNYTPLNNVVIDCITYGCKRGLAVCGSTHNILSNANITGDFSKNREAGVFISNSTHVFVFNASIKDNNQYGILLRGSLGAKFCTIFKCDLERNEVPIAELNNSSNNFFVLNNLKDNKQPQLIKF